MAFPTSPFGGRSARNPGGSRQTGPVFSIGQRAFVNGPGERPGVAPLFEEKGSTVIGNLADGTEVEILGWMPRGTATRYHVRTTGDARTGWIGIADLRPRAAREPAGAAPRTAGKPVWIPLRTPGAPGRARAAGAPPSRAKDERAPEAAPPRGATRGAK